jgi:RNA polymerase sigma-70 factor (ECF subfamily)
MRDVPRSAVCDLDDVGPVDAIRSDRVGPDRVDALGASWHSVPSHPARRAPATTRADPAARPAAAAERRASADRPAPRRPPKRPIPGNLSAPPTSNPMASLSGTHDDPAGLADDAGGPGLGGGAGAGGDPAAADGAARPDVVILRRAQAGDRAAYGQLVLLYQDRLYNAVLRLVGDRDEALELTQEAFTRGLAKIDGFRGDAAPYTWLFRIAVNLALSQLRKVQRARVFSLDAPSGGGRHAGGGRDGDQASALLDRVARDRSAGPGEQLERRERDQQVLAALGRVDAEYRAVLVMRDVEGFDYQQMADILGLPLGTLKSRLFRARLALRDELKTYMR